MTKADAQKRTPFAVCLEQDNIDLLGKLMSGVSLNRDPMLLHSLSTKILNVKYQGILGQLLNNDDPSAESINILSDNGLTPFLAYIEHFCSRYPSLRGEMMQLVNAEAHKHGVSFHKYKLDNQSLFEQRDASQGSQPGSYGGGNAFGGFGAGRAPRKQAFQFGGYPGAASNQNQPGGLGAEVDVVQDAVPWAKRVDLTDQLMEKQVVLPFLECLKLLIEKGADPHVQVQKLRRFRDLDEERRKLAIAKEGREANGQQVAGVRELERAKRREEVLKEREADRRGRAPRAPRRPQGGGKGGARLGGGGPRALGQPGVSKQEGEEYHATMGLQNAFHLAVACPHPRLLDLLVDLKVHPDKQDRRLITPFNLASTTAAIDFVDPRLSGLTTRLITLGVRPDLPDAKGRTPFLNYYSGSRLEEAERMVGLGANVNQQDASGLFALKYALLRRSGPEIEKLVTRHEADVNQVDGKGRNLLHHAVNISSATADATFETEQLLIDLGININLRDQRGRTPLHYAFVKIKDWQNRSQIDPIETVSSLCGCKGLEVDVPDKWQKTPLHYASQRGATICAMYVEKRGADLEAVDIHGNTPLGAALLAKHHNFGIIMI